MVSEIGLRSKVFTISNDPQNYTPPPFANMPTQPNQTFPPSGTANNVLTDVIALHLRGPSCNHRLLSINTDRALQLLMDPPRSFGEPFVDLGSRHCSIC